MTVTNAAGAGPFDKIDQRVRSIIETYTYRTALPVDQAAIFSLYVRVMRDSISDVWGWDQAWQEREFAIHFDPASVILVHRRLELVGYCQVEACADELSVRMIAIHPDHRRRGIGTRLLEAVVASGRSCGKDVVLEVFKVNPEAKQLYRRLGFRRVGETASSEVMRIGMKRRSR